MDKHSSGKFPRSRRIVRSADYKAIYEGGIRVHSENFVLFARKNGIGFSRLGLTVSRKVGCASVRNRTKRLFREIFRRSYAEVPGNLDLIVNPRKGCAGNPYGALRREFLAAAGRIARAGLPGGPGKHDTPIADDGGRPHAGGGSLGAEKL